MSPELEVVCLDLISKIKDQEAANKSRKSSQQGAQFDGAEVKCKRIRIGNISSCNDNEEEENINKIK